MKRCFWVSLLLTSVFASSIGYAWNALGHRLIAQIAYNHLTPQVRQICNYYNHALDQKYPPQSLVNAAVWLDSLHEEFPELSEQHYINIPFTKDGTVLLPPKKENAVKAIYQAKRQIEDKCSDSFEKGFALRILLHVVGDLHQPLHAVSNFNKHHPQGDQGGNLFLLGSNRVASTLHAYWDKGGGFLKSKRHYSAVQIQRRAYSIEKRWPCDLNQMNINPDYWAKESFNLAVSKAYSIKPNEKPGPSYQKMVRNESEKQIALAGCRLAALLNKLQFPSNLSFNSKINPITNSTS